MNRIFARFISFLLHPLLLGFYILFILYTSRSYIGMLSVDIKRLILLYFMLFLGLLPGLISIILYNANVIRTLEADFKKDRLILTGILTVSSCSGLLFFHFIPDAVYVPQYLKIMYILFIMQYVAIFTVSFFWKMSFQMFLMGAMLFVLVSFSNIHHVNMWPALFIWVILSGLAGTSKLSLQKNTFNQIGIGYLTGICSSFILFYFLSAWSN